MSKLITVQYGQTLRDLAMQYYGCADGVQRILALNQIGYTTLAAGAQLLVDATPPMLSDSNLQVMKYYNRVGFVVNSNYKQQPAPILGGFPYTLPFILS